MYDAKYGPNDVNSHTVHYSYHNILNKALFPTIDAPTCMPNQMFHHDLNMAAIKETNKKV